MPRPASIVRLAAVGLTAIGISLSGQAHAQA